MEAPVTENNLAAFEGVPVSNQEESAPDIITTPASAPPMSYAEMARKEKESQKVVVSGDNPYIEMARQEATENRRITSEMMTALDSVPERAADAKSLSTFTGLPERMVEENLDQVKKIARAKQIQGIVGDSPVLRRQLSDPMFAKLAHDDVENLHGIDAVFGTLKRGGSALASLIPNINQGAFGALQAGSDILATAIQPAVGTILPENIFAKISQSIANQGKISESVASRWMPQGETPTERAFFSGIQSLGQTLAFLPAAILTRNPAYALGPMVGTVGGQSYGKARDAGKSVAESFRFGATDAAIEYATEVLPMSWLLKDVLKGTGFLKTLGKQAIAEIPGEQIATVLQDANEWATLNPEKTVKEFLAERPGAAYETLIATVIGVGGQVSVVKAVDSAIGLADKNLQKAERAKLSGEALSNLNDLSKASKVLQRDRGSFEQFIESAAQESDVDTVYIDAKSLFQSGVADQVSAVSPSVASQIVEAEATGGTIAIPAQEYLSTIAPTEFSGQLLDHVRTEQDGYSPAEAREFMETRGEETQAQVAKILEQNEEPFIQSRDEVKNIILEQLDTVGRNTPQARDTQATTVANMYAVMAKDMGIAPAELYQMRPVNFVSGGLESENINALTQQTKGIFYPELNTIALLEKADLSTVFHETMHFFGDFQFDIASQLTHKTERTEGESRLVGNVDAMLKWLGVPDLATWNAMSFEEKRPHHEQMARGFEAYLYEGKAPSLELQSVFQRVREWLIQVYKQIVNLNVELSDEVRQAFDRMLATDDQIELAEQARNMMPLFSNPEASGMSLDEFIAYQQQGRESTATARQELDAKGLRDMRWLQNARSRHLKKLQQEAKEKRNVIRSEVTKEVSSQPIFQAIKWLTKGEIERNGEITKVGKGFRLDLAALKDMYPAGELVPFDFQPLVRRKMAGNDGIHPDMVAEMFGFSSGDQLVRELAVTPPIKEVIEPIVDMRMLEQYGELSTPEAIERAADMAIHNEARAKFVATELNALNKAVGKRSILLSAAREFAANIISRQKIRELKPGRYANAETKAAKASEKAFKSGDIETAATEKRNQLIHNYATKATYDAQEEVSKGLRYLRKFEKRSKTIDPDYSDQIELVLERFDLRAQTNRSIDRRASLASWIESQRNRGIEPDISEQLINEAFTTPYKNMTVEEFRGLVDTVKQIEHLGRLKNRLLTDKQKREFETLKSQIQDSIESNSTGKVPVSVEGQKKSKEFVEKFLLGHRKLASLLRQLDGWKTGIMWDLVLRPLNDSATREMVINEKATAKLNEIYDPVMTLDGGMDQSVFIPEIGISLKRSSRLAIALNWGNTANRQRIMSGDNWSQAQVNAILKTLSKTEADFVNNTWELLDSYWPDVAEKQRRIYGVSPDKVIAEPFAMTVSDGSVVQMRGGYYPIKYDPSRSEKAASVSDAQIYEEMSRGSFTQATTRRGHTKERVAEVGGRPLSKSLGVITSHIAQVSHDLAFHEWLIDTNKILRSNRVKDAIVSNYGMNFLTEIRNQIRDIAIGDLKTVDEVDQIGLYFRSMATRSVMGVSMTTALLQPFGLLQSVVRVGRPYMVRGMKHWLGDAAKFENSMTEISSKSDFMRLRNQTFNRELNEINSRVTKGKGKVAKYYDAGAFFLIQKMQLIADIPTWWGAYEKAIDRGSDESTAVSMADQAVVDAQGGGHSKDLSKFQRSHPYLTMFYSYFNATFNLVVESTSKTNFKNPVSIGGWISDMAMLMVIPAIGPSLIIAMMRGEGEDKDWEWWAKEMAKWQAGYALSLFLLAREASGIVSGFKYEGSPAGRILNQVARLGVQLQQGEADEELILSALGVAGAAVGIPSTQMARSYRGWKAWDNGEAPVTSLLFGPPQKN